LERIRLEKNCDHTDELRASLRDQGVAIASVVPMIEPTSDEAQIFLDGVFRQLGEPIQVFAPYPEWRPIGVRPDLEPTRSQGVGESPLHMDFVNAAEPPDIVVLYCARADPGGGGASLLAPADAVNALPDKTKKRLRRRAYRDGRVENLHNIGGNINPFAVYSPGATWHFRYTGQLLHSTRDTDLLDAVRELDRELRARLTKFVLEAGDVLIIDQHRMVHGRGPLGPAQENLGESRRRLLWQRFIRVNLLGSDR
jgi:Taurine catabolism dioxygenase TauD, TfdA family